MNTGKDVVYYISNNNNNNWSFKKWSSN